MTDESDDAILDRLDSLIMQTETLLNNLFGNDRGYRKSPSVGNRPMTVYGALGTASRYMSIARQGFESGMEQEVSNG